MNCLGVEIEKYTPQSTPISDLHTNFPMKVVTGTWNTESSINVPDGGTGYNGGNFIWIPCHQEGGIPFGLLLASAMTSDYQVKYYIAQRWYITWDSWKQIG